MEIDEATLQRNWRTLLTVCLAYVAILGMFFVAVYHVVPVPDPSQVKARPDAPSVQSATRNLRQPLENLK